MAEAFIVGAVRTPVGRRNGGLAGVHPVDLAAHVLTEIVARTGTDPAAVDALLRERGVRVCRWEDWLAIDRLERDHVSASGSCARCAAIGPRCPRQAAPTA